MTIDVEIQYRRRPGLYAFTSPDGRVAISSADRYEAGNAAVRRVAELTAQGLACRVDARGGGLGHFRKQLQDAGAACRVGLERPRPERQPRWQMPGAPTPNTPTPGPPPPGPPPPVYTSWADYLARTADGERMKRCHAASKKANRKRLLSAHPASRLTGRDVWQIIEAAEGRCIHCRSLAVENRPSSPVTGAPLPWAQVGRRIGSLEHLTPRLGGGDNDRPNLAWACLWCNTWPSERRDQAPDHGGVYPAD